MDITKPLVQLEYADLVRRIVNNEAAYQFKHNLIQESAYGTLLRHDRRSLHRACAQALESTYPHNLDENAALLEQHYAEAGDDAKTFEYAHRAGNAALHKHGYAEALMHYDKATELAPRLVVPSGELSGLYLQRGRTLELAGKYAEAAETYRALEQMGKERGDSQLELRGLLALGTLYTFPNAAQNLEQAQVLNQRSLELARAIHDQEAEVRALWNHQQHAFFFGQVDKSVEYSREALALAERLGFRELRAYILNDVSRPLMSAVSMLAALDALGQAREFWRETNNLPMLADNLASTAICTQLAGDLEAAIQFAGETQELSRSIGNIWNLAYSTGTLLDIAIRRGDIVRALELYAQAVELGRQSGFLINAFFAEIQRATIYGEMGKPAQGIEFLNTVPSESSFFFLESWRLGTAAYLEYLKGDFEALSPAIEKALTVMRMDEPTNVGSLYIGICSTELALAQGRFTDALGLTQRGLERLRANSLKFKEPDVLLRAARASAGLGDIDAAAQACRDAEKIAKSMQARSVLWQILALRAEIESRRGNLDQANSLKAEAREIANWIAAHAPAELAESFRAQPQVRGLFEG